MRIAEMPDNGSRHRYWRCSNPGDEVFTLVLFTGAREEEAFLKTLYTRVESAGDSRLPAWRLYRVE